MYLRRLKLLPMVTIFLQNTIMIKKVADHIHIGPVWMSSLEDITLFILIFPSPVSVSVDGPGHDSGVAVIADIHSRSKGSLHQTIWNNRAKQVKKKSNPMMF